MSSAYILSLMQFGKNDNFHSEIFIREYYFKLEEPYLD